jgi:anti-sigma regulatory factor (Ser/Thr protein kinase)/heme-degrading monooxygenase HmoA
VIAEARRSHPVVSHAGAADVSHDYCGIERVADRSTEPLPEAPRDAEELTVNMPALRDARHLVHARAQAAGPGVRSDDFALAVNEVLSNRLHHAREDGTLRVWEEREGLVCEVRDRGHILQPLIGREKPSIGQIGGHGMWLVNLVCDLVQVRSSARGSTVRMQMNRAPRTKARRASVQASTREDRMHARIGRISYSQENADQLKDHVRENVVPNYESADGFKGFTLLLDASRGEAIGISFWESEDAMRATDDLGDQARQGAAEAGSGSDQGPQHFEVALDTMA